MIASRKDYIAVCRAKFEEFAASHRYLMRHVRKDGKPIGTVILWIGDSNGWFHVGFSKCNKLDKYNRYIGIARAIADAEINHDRPVPRQLREAYDKLLAFANSENGKRCLT